MLTRISGIILILLSSLSFSYAQDLFLWGEQSFPSTRQIKLDGDGLLFSGDFSCRIAKNGEGGYFVLTAPSMSGVLIKGKTIVYLDDGNVISLEDEGYRDHVDRAATTVYLLPPEKIQLLKTADIHTVRFSLKCEDCAESSEEGNFTGKPEYRFSATSEYVNELFNE